MATTQQILADYAAIDYTPPYALAGQPTATLPAAPDPTLVAAYQPLTNDAVISAIEGETYTLVTVDAVIREYQGAFGTVPDQAGAAFWTHAIDDGTASLATLSIAFALSPQFSTLYNGATATTPANTTLVTAFYQNVLQRAPDAAGLAFWLGSGLNAAQLLQVFTQSAEAVNLFAPHVIAFQNLEAAGTPPVPPTSLFSLNAGFTLTINADTPPAFATSLTGAIFNAPPGSNILGPSNTLNAGDNLQDTANDGVLNYTAVAPSIGANPALAAGVIVNGIATANILNTSAGTAGFSGNITGLTAANMLAGTNGNVLLGLASAGLNTALANIGISADSNFTAWIAAAALAGATNSVNVNLHGNNSSLDLLVTGGGNNGYETAVINSAGGANIFDLDVNHTSLATIKVTGDQNLTMDAASTALNIANLHNFDGSAATGNLTIAFGGTGNVTADGGSGNDHFTFPATDSVITSHGNAGDDIFEFLATNGGTTTFNNLDLVDGGTGTNRLILEADNGQLLGAGVGAQILNIGTIQHDSIGNTNGTILADMGQSGSATVLQLNGQYNGNDVNVSNLITAKSVLFTGDNIDDFTLDATSLLGQVNLTMAITDTAGQQNINHLHLTVGNLLNLTSAGNSAAATANLITDVSDVNANVSITGPHSLSFGFTTGNAYDFGGGIIDATALTGNLQIGLGDNSQTLALGIGNDTVQEFSAVGPDSINLGPLATGGNDNVIFHQTFTNSALGIINGATNYTQLSGTLGAAPTGFNVANDLFTIDASFAPAAGQITLQETNATGVFNPPAVFNYNIGTALVNLAGSFTDMIKVDSAVGGGQTAQTLFNNSMQATGSIIVAAAANDILFAAYNNDTSQAVLMVVHPDTAGPANIINTGDHVDVVGQITMSFTDFQTFGNNGSLAFV